MNANAITARLDDYDKVRSNKEAIDFKKNLDTKLSLRDKRELAKTFFNNSGMISILDISNTNKKCTLGMQCACSVPAECTAFLQNYNTCHCVCEIRIQF